MPASIFGDRFVGFRQPAWHGLGEVFTDRINVSEAVARAKVGFEIHKAQNFARMDTGRFDDQGRPIVHSVPTNSYSVMREPTYDDPEWQVLSTVGEQWTLRQISHATNTTIPHVLQYLNEGLGKEIEVTATIDVEETIR